MLIRWPKSFIGCPDEIFSVDRELLTVVNWVSADCALRLDMPNDRRAIQAERLRNSQMRFCFSRTVTRFGVEAEIRALVGQLWMHPHCSR